MDLLKRIILSHFFLPDYFIHTEPAVFMSGIKYLGTLCEERSPLNSAEGLIGFSGL